MLITSILTAVDFADTEYDLDVVPVELVLDDSVDEHQAEQAVKHYCQDLQRHDRRIGNAPTLVSLRVLLPWKKN